MYLYTAQARKEAKDEKGSAMAWRSDFSKWVRTYCYIREFLQSPPSTITTGLSILLKDGCEWAKKEEEAAATDAQEVQEKTKKEKDIWFERAVAVVRKWIY